jgi:hypothetical protein
MVVSVICAVLNLVWPGSGTVLAGLLPDTIVKVQVILGVF